MRAEVHLRRSNIAAASIFHRPGQLDFHYDLPTWRAPYYLWLGGGPALVLRDDGRSDDGNETDLGVNLIAGIGFGKGQALRPYVQGKVLVSDETEAALAIGLRFY